MFRFHCGQWNIYLVEKNIRFFSKTFSFYSHVPHTSLLPLTLRWEYISYTSIWLFIRLLKKKERKKVSLKVSIKDSNIESKVIGKSESDLMAGVCSGAKHWSQMLESNIEVEYWSQILKSNIGVKLWKSNIGEKYYRPILKQNQMWLEKVWRIPTRWQGFVLGPKANREQASRNLVWTFKLWWGQGCSRITGVYKYKNTKKRNTKKSVLDRLSVDEIKGNQESSIILSNRIGTKQSRPIRCCLVQRLPWLFSLGFLLLGLV